MEKGSIWICIPSWHNYFDTVETIDLLTLNFVHIFSLSAIYNCIDVGTKITKVEDPIPDWILGLDSKNGRTKCL
jgi:hypothetical protein